MKLSQLKTLSIQLLSTMLIVVIGKLVFTEKVSFADLVIINFMIFYLREGRTVNIDTKSVDVFQTKGNIVYNTKDNNLLSRNKRSDD